MRLEQLKCLADIARTGSINKTAQRLFISQQAVSKSIKQLEQEFGAPLLVRTKTGVTLTEAGKEVVLFAEKILQEGDVLKEKIQEICNKGQNAFNITLASTSSVANLVIPSMIASLNAQQREAKINVLQFTSFDSVMQAVQEGKCDIGLMTINETEFQQQFLLYADLLENELLMQDRLVVVMNRRFYNGVDTVINGEAFYQAKAKTLYNIIPIEPVRQSVYDATVIGSNDADFHRSMMDKAEAMTIMSGLAYQYYFNKKRYVAVEFHDRMDTSLLHIAVYRKDAGQDVRDFITMMRREMHTK